MFPEQTEILSPHQWVETHPVDSAVVANDNTSSPSEETISIDFETFYSSTYSVSKSGIWSYCHDLQFNAYLVAVTDGHRTCVCPPPTFPWQTIAGLNWVSHNRDFDRAVWERLTEMSVIPKNTRPASWFCSSALCAYLQLPRALAGAVRDVFGVKLDKGVRIKAKGQGVEGDLWGPPEDVVRYAAKDAEACLALWEQRSDEWPEHERQLFELTSEMGRHGLCIDWQYVQASRRELEEIVSSLGAALPWSPALSIKQFQSACDTVGVTPPKSTSTSDPEFTSWISYHSGSKAAAWVRNMQRLRSANRTAKVLNSIETRRMPSNRMAYGLRYCGASTGRWSGDGGLNLQNLNRQTTEGVDLRRAIVAPQGYRLAVVDYAQIESRVLLFLAGDIDSLEMFRANPEADAYEIHARATMDYKEMEPLREFCDRTGSKLRQLAKARVLGLGFGCGWKRFIEVAISMAGLDLSVEESKRVVNDFRKTNVKIVNLWWRLNAACASCNGNDYALPLLCTQKNPELKRYLIYRDILANGEGIECTVGGERVHVYGGLLAENWTQATARDVLASAWLRCVDAGFVPVLSVHDELVFELPAETADADLLRIVDIMEQPLDWAPALPLKADGRLMDHYTK